MDEAVLRFSKFSNKLNHNNISFDVVMYKNVLYAGKNLFKNFSNFLCDEKSCNVVKFTNTIEAERYFNDFVF